MGGQVGGVERQRQQLKPAGGCRRLMLVIRRLNGESARSPVLRHRAGQSASAAASSLTRAAQWRRPSGVVTCAGVQTSASVNRRCAPSP